MEQCFMWSTDECSYHGESPSEAHAILEAVAENKLEEGDGVWVSRMELIKLPNFQDFLLVETLIENADDDLYETCATEESMFELSKSDEVRLMDEMNEAWHLFFKNHPGRFRKYFEAVEPKQIIITKHHIELST